MSGTPHDDGRDVRVVVLQSNSPRAVEWTAERLADGGIVAIPTDTVYGIATSLNHPDALRRLYTVKGRPEDKPIPILISSVEMIEHLTSGVSPEVELLLEGYWPGALTVVLPARAGMPAEVTAGGRTVGLRMPNHQLAIEVIGKAGGAIACTSANLSGEAPATTASEAAQQLGDRLDLILDGGRTPGGVASTVIAIEGDRLTLLREGPMPFAELQQGWQQLLAGRG